MKITVLGAGAWGTAVAAHLASRHDVTLWARNATLLRDIQASRENTAYLPRCPLPKSLLYDADLRAATAYAAGADGLVVLAGPVAGLRPLLESWVAVGEVPRHFVWLCKGFEAETQRLPHQVVADVLGAHSSDGASTAASGGASGGGSWGALTGPSFAKEVAQGLPVALTVASTSETCCERTVAAFHHHAMRIYTSDDVVGVEVGGAVKNVLAIATGVADGMGLGFNARAALVTRGLAEMTRLGMALGARADTFTGLSGVGDLILTATGDLSRNRTVGMKLAAGQTLDTILRDLGHVAEGVRCAQAVSALATSRNVDMPITRAVCRVLFEQLSPRDAVEALLQREAKAER